MTARVDQFTFRPQSLTVPVGTKVIWRIEDSAEHNVTAIDKSFGSEDLGDGLHDRRVTVR
ncbi:hypothetical protein [Actinokineospora xionganensis]|uniref:Uncharacterized protein n=1 Tax=Actinokineospora xionganensis TaxID=2684470 RepID=A0ABR7L4N4_9PSEU|nr:hypothetical protein [Actinokineospora xionganensis]MBC6447483.1 hypothetical protein [Actinokineospora xionganensis]